MPRLRLYPALAVLLLAAWPARAQEAAPLDTARVYQLESIVVTADRSAGLLSSSTGAVSVLRGEELRRLPVTTLADVLEQTPGFAFLALDGLGYDPQATVRGFYGGGEAEYVVVLLDGRPLNNLEAGLMNWNQVPLSGIASVEVLRGGVSSLYGDAAIGGVVNVVTTPEAERSVRWSLAGGSYGSLAGQAAVHGTWDGRAVSLFGDVLRTDGFRDHAGRAGGSLGASLALLDGPRHALSLSTLNHWRAFDDPGPLSGTQLAQSRTQESPFFRFDHTDEQTYRLALDGTTRLGPAAQLDGSVTGEYRRADVLRTLPLSPDFADTKNRVLRTTRLLGTAQLTLDPRLFSFENRLVAGLDASLGALATRYYAVVTGAADAYAAASGRRGDLDTQGEGTRSTAAAFLQYDLHPAPRLRLTLGSRLDWLRDTFEPKRPAGGARQTATHTALSPKAGLNVRYAQSARHVGNWYASVSRSFKAPVLDQLYDQRSFPVPFPPFSVTISNADLKPQRGTSVETGVYHRAELAPGTLAAELSLSIYQMDMTDEIDFSFEAFRNVNIGKSRHRGVEAGLKAYVQDRATVFVNYTLQAVTLRFGENQGNYVKAIPRDFVSAGFSAAHRTGLSGSATLHAARRIFLDDANTIRLPDYTTVEARLAYERRPFTLALEAFNLLDATYSTTGFPDPAGTPGVVYFFPAAGRTLRLGLSVAW